MKTKIPIPVFSLLMIYSLLLAPLVVSGSVTLLNSIILLASVFAFYCLGAVLLATAGIVDMVLPVSYAAMSVFVGGLLFSLLLFVSPNPLFLIISLLSVAFLLLLFYRKQTAWSFKPGISDIVAFTGSLLMIALISMGDDNAYQFVAQQAGSACCGPDTYFFTSITASLRHGTIYNSVFEINSSVNYQILGFLIPALWANILNIFSHQALWGLALPFYKLLIFLLCYEIPYYYLRDKVARNNYLFILASISLPVLLAPLHPFYLIKGDIGKFIFNGLGYLIPAGTIPFPVGIVVFLFCLFLFPKIDWKDSKITGDKIFFTIGFSLIILGKIPIFISFFFFIGAIILKRILFDKEKILNYAGYFLCSMVLSVILFKVCMGEKVGPVTSIRYGHLVEVFGQWYGRKSKGLMNNIIMILLIFFTYLVWLGLRLWGLLGLLKSKNKGLIDFFIGGICSLLAVSLLNCFLRISSIDANGKIIDITFNYEGFIRSSFYFLSIISSIGILYLLYGKVLKPGAVKATYITAATWCCISLTSLIYTQRNFPICKPLDWYTDNINQLKTGRYNDGLIVVDPQSSIFGSMLASSEYGKYWSSTRYIWTVKNEYRWKLFKNLLDAPKAEYLAQMKNEGVKYLIATPADSAEVSVVSTLFPGSLHKVKETNWIYELP